MAQLNQNLSGYNSYESDYELLPPGEYPVRITDGELKTPKAGGNQYLNLRYDVTDGPKKGRVLFDMLSLWSNNATAREIACRKLKSIGLAIRLPNPDYIGDTDELLNGEMIVRIGIKKDETGQYADRNEVKGYKPIAGVAVGGAPMAQPSMAGTTPPPMARPATPWAQTA